MKEEWKREESGQQADNLITFARDFLLKKHTYIPA